MTSLPPDDPPPHTTLLKASAHGWVKRPDLGPDVWELPSGALYLAHPDEKEPWLRKAVR